VARSGRPVTTGVPTFFALTPVRRPETSLAFAPLGDTGPQSSEIQFGTWRFGRETEEGNVEIDEARGHELLDAYAEAGGRFIDTADVYGGGKCEEWIGDWLAQSDYDREESTIASKIF
jgi:aryl-alcohol dehydrogenase-like predicted oxidoreductase